jgi:hypothetical protein
MAPAREHTLNWILLVLVAVASGCTSDLEFIDPGGLGSAVRPTQNLAPPGNCWKEIEPGISRREDVVNRFGLPNAIFTVSDPEVLGYADSAKMKGTLKVNFIVDPATAVVQEIHVYPAPAIKHGTIESHLGPECPEARAPQPTACFQRAAGPDRYVYSRLNLEVFFERDRGPGTVRPL